MSDITIIDDYLTRLRGAIDAFDRKTAASIAQTFRSAYEDERMIFVFGNGGSASLASHLASDLNKDACFCANKRFKVLSLNDNVPTMLALANDEGYETLFVEQLKNFARPGDVVVGMSVSGNSENVLRAIRWANELGCVTVGFTGFDGGELKKIANESFHVPVADMQICQDLHMSFIHILLKLLREAVR